MSLESGQLVFVKDGVEGWLPATVGATNGQGEDMSLELVHEDGRTEVRGVLLCRRFCCLANQIEYPPSANHVAFFLVPVVVTSAVWPIEILPSEKEVDIFSGVLCWFISLVFCRKLCVPFLGS